MDQIKEIWGFHWKALFIIGLANLVLGLLLQSFNQAFAFWSMLASGTAFLILAYLDHSYMNRLMGFEKDDVVFGLLHILGVRRMIELSLFVTVLFATIMAALAYRQILSALIPLTLMIAIALILTLRTEWELGLIQERHRPD